MATRTIFGLVIVWFLSLFAVATIVKAQNYGLRPLPEPRILAGPDVGIRIEAEQNGVPVGSLVARIDGRWVEVRLGPEKPGPRPAR